MENNFNLPLMGDNIDRKDINKLVDFLSQDPIPRLTNGPKVKEFEKKWSEWLGVKHSLFVNSGSSANQLTMLTIKYLFGEGEIILPPLTWASDVASVVQCGLKPVFCDINLKNLSFDLNQLKEKITDRTKAIFITHVLGINGLTDELISLCEERGILLIEDVCESHGATFREKKLGSYGFVSNFSFYFAHHLSTIEGGMVCTNDDEFYQYLRAFRSHGMLRECSDEKIKKTLMDENPDLNKEFIFIHPAFNFRSTEINAVLGLSQIEKLDSNNNIRRENFQHFIDHLNSDIYLTDLEMDGQCNYAFIVILNPNIVKDEGAFNLRDKIERVLAENKVEFRRGLSGGGSQLKQPFIKRNYSIDEKQFPSVEHVHHFSWYIGNYPGLEKKKIDHLLEILNTIEVGSKVGVGEMS